MKKKDEEVHDSSFAKSKFKCIDMNITSIWTLYHKYNSHIYYLCISKLYLIYFGVVLEYYTKNKLHGNYIGIILMYPSIKLMYTILI